MWQQLHDHAVALRGQPGQHIFQIRVGVMPVELGTLDQTHDGRTTLARTHPEVVPPLMIKLAFKGCEVRLQGRAQKGRWLLGHGHRPQTSRLAANGYAFKAKNPCPNGPHSMIP